MTQSRNIDARDAGLPGRPAAAAAACPTGSAESGGPVDAGAGTRPLSARSVIASTLLGVDPPRLPSRQLVRAGELFGIAEGTIRVALSRMVAAGELEADDGWYRLVAEALLERQARQAEGRHPVLRSWSGEWVLWVVEPARRSAADRSELRAAFRGLRAAEVREGVWTRPDNLDPQRQPHLRAVVDRQCRAFVGRPSMGGGTGEVVAGDAPGRVRGGSGGGADAWADDAQLAAELWDLAGWGIEAHRLMHALDPVGRRLGAGDADALAPGWELSAAVLRHLLADPLLPSELLPVDWPGDDLRAAYDTYDAAFKACWRDAFVRR